jgi:signal transduction histidine kinase
VSVSWRRPPWLDVALAAAVGAELVVEMLLTNSRRGPLAANLVAAVALAAPLAWRRVAPLAAVAAIGVAGTVTGALLTHPPDLVGTFATLALASFTVAAHEPRQRALIGLGAVVATVLAVSLVTDDAAADQMLFPGVIFAGVWVLGRVARGRAKLTAELAARTRQIERERAERERDAVVRERARIARELHDVVAHSVSVMVVQAGAARRVLDRDPDASIGALGAVETTGREALTEMRRLLGILRPEGEDVDHSPQPSLERLGALVARSRDAGLDVELRSEGEPGPLAPGVDLTAFRLVQEGLTNALKHGGRGPARVTLRWSEDLLEVEVANRVDGEGVIGDSLLGSGQGLVGMRERVALCGGELRAGPVGRGFVVRARLPRDRASSPAPAAA